MTVFNIGAGEMIVIALILLMAVGPEQLPSLIRRVGRTVSEVKGMTEGLRSEFMSGLEEIERATDPEAWAAGNEPTKVKPPKTAPANPFADSTSAASAKDATGGDADAPADKELAAVNPDSDSPDVDGADGPDVDGTDAVANAFPDVAEAAAASNGAGHADDAPSVADPAVDAWVADTPEDGEDTGIEEQA